MGSTIDDTMMEFEQEHGIAAMWKQVCTEWKTLAQCDALYVSIDADLCPKNDH